MMKKISILFGSMVLLMVCITGTFLAASGTWASGQKYDLNGLNSCHSSNNVDTYSFNFKVWDEYHAVLGDETVSLDKNEYNALTNAGGIGSKECVIRGSKNHSPGFNS